MQQTSDDLEARITGDTTTGIQKADQAASNAHSTTIIGKLSQEGDKWQESLDDESNIIVVLDYSRADNGVYEWREQHFKNPSDLAQLNRADSVKQPEILPTRLILVEGLSKDVIGGLQLLKLDVPIDFFRHHLDNSLDRRTK